MPNDWEDLSDRDRLTALMQQMVDSRNENATAHEDLLKIGTAVNNQAKIIELQAQKIASLEEFKAVAITEVEQLKVAIADKSPILELSFDGIPATFANQQKIAISEVLKKLGVGDLMSFFIDSRLLSNPPPNPRSKLLANFLVSWCVPKL